MVFLICFGINWDQLRGKKRMKASLGQPFRQATGTCKQIYHCKVLLEHPATSRTFASIRPLPENPASRAPGPLPYRLRGASGLRPAGGFAVIFCQREMYCSFRNAG